MTALLTLLLDLLFRAFAYVCGGPDAMDALIEILNAEEGW